MMEVKNGWKSVLKLDKDRKLVSGSEDVLAEAISRAADLRIYTEFRHNEHIDTGSSSNELIKEVADFRITYLLDGRWVAGIINLRQPIEVPVGFGPRPSMSFFMYNQNAEQAIARPYLDSAPTAEILGESLIDDHSAMPKYHQFDGWDVGSNAPSSNFIYDFDTYSFMVCDNWEEVYGNDQKGKATFGTIELLAQAFENGREIKVGIQGLCEDLVANGAACLEHEVFVHCGSAYYYTDRKLLIAATQPVVRVKPDIPLRYKSKGWDFGWLMVRSDGFVAHLRVDPYTLKFVRSNDYYAVRWFIR